MTLSRSEAVRLLLDAGASPSRPLPGDHMPAMPPIPLVAAAVQFKCPAEVAGLLLAAGADPDAPGQDGRFPYQAAVRQGMAGIAQLLARLGGRDETTETDRFLFACRQGIRAEVEQLLQCQPDLAGQLPATPIAPVRPKGG
jgi:hypothetical protein